MGFVIGAACVLIALLAIALCRAAGEADRRMEALWAREEEDNVSPA